MRQIKAAFILALFFLSVGLAYSQINVYIFGKSTFTNSSGSASDYVAGTNDFPLASSFTTLGLGAGITYNMDRFFFGLETHFNFGGKTTLTDTSDNDTISINTYKTFSALAVAGYNLLNKPNFRIFVNGGLGISPALGAKEKVYTSRLGYEARIRPSESSIPFVGFGGAGFSWKYSPSLEIFVSGRYQYTALDAPQKAVAILGGVMFAF